MCENIKGLDITIFDTETTGLEPESGDRIVEIAAIRLQGENKALEFQTLVNPGRQVSEAAFQVNGITQEMLEHAPGIEKAGPQFLEFIRGSLICSYNAGFDLKFLNNELSLIGERFPDEIIVLDILKMARRILPGLERYALWFVAQHLGIKQEQKHRAFSDVELALAVFNRLKDILQARGVFDFTQTFNLFAVKESILKDINSQKLIQIQKAIDSGFKLKIKYLSGSGGRVLEREVMPNRLIQENNLSYLVGYCCLKNEERTFRVDGILQLELV